MPIIQGKSPIEVDDLETEHEPFRACEWRALLKEVAIDGFVYRYDTLPGIKLLANHTRQKRGTKNAEEANSS